MIRGGGAGARVMNVLKQTGGGLSVKHLCQRLDLSSMAVRRQLSVLEGRRLVSSRRVKQKTGRPTQLYYLTEEGHEEFPRDYSSLSIELLSSSRDLLGKTHLNDLFARRKDELLSQARKRVLGKTLEARVHEVAQLLTEHGYMASWEKLDDGRYLIREMNCALARVARKFPQVCIFEEHFLRELLDASVKRRHHILQKDQFCSYLVEGVKGAAGSSKGEVRSAK